MLVVQELQDKVMLVEQVLQQVLIMVQVQVVVVQVLLVLTGAQETQVMAERVEMAQHQA